MRLPHPSWPFALLAPALFLAGAAQTRAGEWETLLNRIENQSATTLTLAVKDPDSHSGLVLGAAFPSGAHAWPPAELDDKAGAIPPGQTLCLYLKREDPEAGGTLYCRLRNEDGDESGFVLAVHGHTSEFQASTPRDPSRAPLKMDLRSDVITVGDAGKLKSKPVENRPSADPAPDTGDRIAAANS